MRIIGIKVSGLVTATLVICGSAASSSAQPPADEVTRAQYDTWMTQLSNWGRWGADDQLGALNAAPITLLLNWRLPAEN